MSGQPRKRAAYEPGGALLEPTRYNPGMRRPVTTVTGAALVLLRAALGAIALSGGWTGWDGTLQNINALLTALGAAVGDTSHAGFVAGTIVLLAAQAVLAVLILAGWNWPRVLVMIFAVIDISSAFAVWIARGAGLGLEGSLYTLALDILILLALSSRSAAAYARRNERRA